MTTNNKELPFISVVIPCRNEKHFINQCLDSVVKSDYPANRLEVMVVDGMSTDGTREIISSYARRFPFLKMMDNTKHIAPAAMNIGIRNARGSIIIRMDAHSIYPPDFISISCQYLETVDTEVVGGPIVTKPGADTFMARLLALLTSHPFGVGNSSFRTSATEGYVDTVPFGAYKREVFDKIGLFDERLVRNQDNEFCSRLLSNGCRIYMTPALTVDYFNQSTASGLLKQALRTGMWFPVTLRINRASFKWRYFIPFVFVTTLLGLAGLTPLFPAAGVLLALIGAIYAALAIASAIQIGIKNGMQYSFVLPVMFFLYHACYGLGTWGGLYKLAFEDLKVQA